jgi:flavin-dependent dehydrogenase
VDKLPGFGTVLPRMALDEILVRRAEQVGAVIVDGFQVETLAVDADGVTVIGADSDQRGRFFGLLVIVADGARSRLAAGPRRAPTSDKRDLFALRAYYEGVRLPSDTAAMFFGQEFFPGYAWIFPIGGGRANVGMGMLQDVSRRYRINLRNCFIKWLAEDPGAQEILGSARLRGRIVGWPLSIYEGAQGNCAERVLVIGDAGRFVDPINGEGIHTALETAGIAARVADEALARRDLSAESLFAYEKKWRAALDLDLSTSNLMVTVVQNRALLPLWSLLMKMVAEKSRGDVDFAARCGGVLAGVVPSHESMAPALAVKTLLQSPDFWIRNSSDVGKALTSVLKVKRGRTPVDGPEPDVTQGRDFDLGWAAEVLMKSWKVSAGLRSKYGVPWAAGRRWRLEEEDGRRDWRSSPECPPNNEDRDSLPRLTLGTPTVENGFWSSR